MPAISQRRLLHSFEFQLFPLQSLVDTVDGWLTAAPVTLNYYIKYKVQCEGICLHDGAVCILDSVSVLSKGETVAANDLQ